MSWVNFLVSGKFSRGTEGIIPAESLLAAITSRDGREGYHGTFDLEDTSLKLEEDTGKLDESGEKIYVYHDQTPELLKKFPKTTKRYVGLARPALGYVWFDFDSDDLAKSQADTLSFLDWLSVPDCLIYFTGSKGFHVGVNFNYFGLEVSAELPKIIGSLAHKLKELFPSMDAGIYNANRKFRAPETRHDKTGLFKTRLTPGELRSSSVEAIRLKAATKGKEPILEPSPCVSLPKLTMLISACPTPVSTEPVDPYFTRFENFASKVCIQKMLDNRTGATPRNILSLRIISDLYNTGRHRADAVKIMKEWCVKNHKAGDDAWPKCEEQINGIYSGSLKVSYGCQDKEKAERCDVKCGIWKELSPEKRPKPIGAPKKERLQAKEEGKLPKEFEVAKYMLASLEAPLVVQGRSIFRYEGVKWVELREDDEAEFKRAIMRVYEGKVTSRVVDSTFKTFKNELKRVPRGISLFDVNPFKVNFRNGTLHLRENADKTYRTEFLAHSKDDYLITVLPYDYKEGDTTVNPEFEKMLGKLFKGDPDEKEKLVALRQLFGACLVPLYPHLFFLYGPPGTGKSTAMLLASKLVSEENICSVEPCEMHGFNMESMIGKLVNLETDVSTTKPMDDAQIKRITDRRKVRIRRKGIADVYGFLPGIHLFGGNDVPPTLDGISRAHDRRWTFIEFKNSQLNSDDFKVNYAHFVYDQCPQGILNFALEGLKDLIAAKGRYENPASGVEKMDQWQTLSNPVALFFRAIDDGEMVEGCTLKRDPEGRIYRTRLYEIFKAWSEAFLEKNKVWGAGSFYAALDKLGLAKSTIKGKRFIIGLTESEIQPKQF